MHNYQTVLLGAAVLALTLYGLYYSLAGVQA